MDTMSWSGHEGVMLLLLLVTLVMCFTASFIVLVLNENYLFLVFF